MRCCVFIIRFDVTTMVKGWGKAMAHGESQQSTISEELHVDQLADRSGKQIPHAVIAS
jgi:hypothetical protein